MGSSVDLTRRGIHRQTFAFSALASLGSSSKLAIALPPGPSDGEILIVGDWGIDTDHTGQSAVAHTMRKYSWQREWPRDPTAALVILDDRLNVYV